MDKSNFLKASFVLVLLVAIFSCPSSFGQAEQHHIYLHQGWNLIGLLVTPLTSYTAESLGKEINSQGGSCSCIMGWDGSDWETHFIGTASADFPIDIEESYFILCDAASTWTVEGSPIGYLSYSLNDGWTLLNTPFETLSAESMGDDINSKGGTCNRIMSWDGSGWATHLIDMPFGDFPINTGKGYFVLCDSPTIWEYKLDSEPPLPPTLNPVTSPTNVSSQTLTGTKDVGTSIYINGYLVVPLNNETIWSYNQALTEGNNDLIITACNKYGLESDSIAVNIFLDTSAPTTPQVTDDGAYTTSTTQLHATWSSEDPQIGIAEYQYAIGTSSGATDIVGWTSTGTATEVTKTGLTLAGGQTYFFNVKAKNGVGSWSAVGSSDGIKVNQHPPVINTVTPADATGFYSEDLITLSAEANDPDKDDLQYQFSVDGEIKQPWNASPTYNWSSLASNAGLHTIKTEVTDGKGGTASQSAEVYIFLKPIGLPGQ